MRVPGSSTHIITLALILAASPVMAQWQKLPPMPEPNGGFVCGADRTGIVVMGGTNWKDDTKHWLKRINRFDPKTMRWENLGSLAEPLAYAACDVRRSDDSLIILGGSNGNAPVKAISIVRAAKDAQEPAPALPAQIVLSAGGIIGDAFIIAGGTDDAANLAGFTNRAFSLDLTKKTLTVLPDYPGRPFAMATSAVSGDELFVFCGAHWDAVRKTITNTAESYAFSVVKNQWRKLKPYPLAIRGPAAVMLDEHHIYVAGGYGGDTDSFVTTAFIYDVRTDSYAEAAPLPYAALIGLVRLDGHVYSLGGEDKAKSRTDAVWRIRSEELLK